MKEKFLYFVIITAPHKKYETMKTICKFSFEILFNLEYSSTYNPIEEVFKLIKQNVKQRRMDTLKNLKFSYNESINQVSKNQILNCYNKFYKLIDKWNPK